MLAIKNLLIKQLLLVCVNYAPCVAFMTKEQQNDYHDIRTCVEILQHSEDDPLIIHPKQIVDCEMN